MLTVLLSKNMFRALPGMRHLRMANLRSGPLAVTFAKSSDISLYLRRPVSTSCYLSSKEPKSEDGFRVISPTASGDKPPKTGAPIYQVTFILPNGERLTAKGHENDSLLDVVVDNDLDIDGFGACEGTLACSTCHLILKQEDFDRIPNKQSDEELDMLDLAYDLTDTSRLGCQIFLTKELDGLEVEVPASVNDQRLS